MNSKQVDKYTGNIECVHLCGCACERESVFMYDCVSKRERMRMRKKERDTEREGVSVGGCMCVCEREKYSVCVRMWSNEFLSKKWNGIFCVCAYAYMC